MRVRVPVHTFGEPQGVKMQGGVFEIVTREVEIECLPGDIPEEFRVDVSDLMIGKQLRAGDFPIDPEKMKLLTDPAARARARRHAQEGRGAAPEAAVAAEAAPAEPEVIKKGKKEEEGEEGAEAAPKAEKREEEVARRGGGIAAGFDAARVRHASASYEIDRRPRQSRPRIRVDAAQPGLPGGGPLAERAGIRVTRPEAKSHVGLGEIAGQEVVLAKPQTMMNLSGVAVRMLLERYECDPAEMIVLVDEVDLPWGMLRIRERGSAGDAQRTEVDDRLDRHERIYARAHGSSAGKDVGRHARITFLAPMGRKPSAKRPLQMVADAAEAVRADFDRRRRARRWRGSTAEWIADGREFGVSTSCREVGKESRDIWKSVCTT